MVFHGALPYKVVVISSVVSVSDWLALRITVTVAVFFPETKILLA